MEKVSIFVDNSTNVTDEEMEIFLKHLEQTNKEMELFLKQTNEVEK